MPYAGLLIALTVNIALALTDKRTSKDISGSAQVIGFSFYKTVSCALLSLALLPVYGFYISPTGVVISALAGIFHAASVVLIMESLKRNEGLSVNLFMSAGVIVPTILGWVIWDQALNGAKIISFLVLFLALRLMLGIKKLQVSSITLLSTMLLFYGLLMLTQAAFPKYCESESRALFSLIMYSTSALILFIVLKVKRCECFRLNKSLRLLLVLAAVLNLTINLLLTHLSSELDASVVFPAVHGLKLVFITLLSSLIWKERLSLLQMVGSFLSILCVCILSI